ncbi:hypothetical protein [Candidatus Cyanaurora vandensis]|uniref:hypothetical protein n=1 Tax=Candidatus Cyanaurora vandensis TaxID=2714958 RepID=UPI00257CD538|nr:hypothetical protein [Candidatus Cyanaurora vandensis]
MVMNFLAPQSPTTEVDLDFKTFFVSLVESACRDGLTLADIDQEIAGVREGLDVPGLESWPLKEWATQTYWAYQNNVRAAAKVEVCGLCGKIAPYRELNCASFCPYTR